MTAPTYKMVGVNLPSLLPFQAAPQNEEQVVPYLQALHNYLAGDRLAVVQTLNVLSRDRMLAAEVWDDLRVAAASVRVPAVGGPDWVQVADGSAPTTGVYSWAFDDGAEESVYFMAQLPHGYKQGSDIEFHVHWVPAANGGPAEVVSWGLEYLWVSIGGVIGNTVTSYGNTVYPDPGTSLVANKHYVTDVAEIDGTGKTISSMLVCRLFRDATGTGLTDSYGDDAILLEADFHYQADSVGSPDEDTKPV